MKKAKLKIGFLAALVILFFTGCNDLDKNNELQNQPDGDQLGHLVIKLTDAPFPFDMIEAATVNIVKVEIRKVCECDEDEYPYVELPLPDDAEGFNLLELRNGVTADLVEMGIEPFLVSSSLLLICAQRLMRRLCPKCKLIFDALMATG